MYLQGSIESQFEHGSMNLNLSTFQVRNNVISDSLSRVTPPEFQDSNADKDILAVNFLQYSSIEERERDEVLQETNKSKEFQSLKHYISTGWPVKRSRIPVFLHPYWNFRDELTIESGILMKNSKVLIPETLKQKYLRQIHQDTKESKHADPEQENLYSG